MKCDKCGQPVDVRTELIKILNLPPGDREDLVLMELALKEIERLQGLAKTPPWPLVDWQKLGTGTPPVVPKPPWFPGNTGTPVPPKTTEIWC